MAFYAIGAAIGIVVAPIGWVVLFAGLVAAGELSERRVARALLAADESGTASGITRCETPLAASHIATAIVLALGTVMIGIFAESHYRILPLCLLAVAIFDVAVTGHQILKLMLTRQIIFLGAVIAITLYDVLGSDQMTPWAIAAEILPLLLLAVVVFTVSAERARDYRDQLRRELQLADARDEAQRLNATKNNLIATVSHELRTQLNGVLGMAQILLTTQLTDAQRQQAEVIAESGRCLNTLLNDLLDFAKLDAGKMTIEPIPGDLSSAVGHIARLFDPLAVEKASPNATPMPTTCCTSPARRSMTARSNPNSLPPASASPESLTSARG
jgi:signal transduction histidine kinase